MATQSGTTWERLPTRRRKALIWSLWFIVWVCLVAGLFNRNFFEYVVVLSAIHLVLFLMLFRFSFTPFPVQVRVAYLIWVAVGTYVPHMEFLMYITLLGLATNLFLGYCPLARMMYLMPWNNDEKFSLAFVGKVFFSPPMAGKFNLQPKED
jgi:hypothetical protein